MSFPLNPINLFYTPPNSTTPVLDESASILTDIFGSPIQQMVGGTGAAPGGGSQYSGHLLTNILSYFNTMVLLLVGAIFVYVVFVGTINTARDGKFLGRMDTHWTPLRLILGPVFIFPVQGFSLVQYISMYCILMGVNVADHVWRYALKQIQVQPPASMPLVVDQAVANQIGTIFVYSAVKKAIGTLSGIQASCPSISGSNASGSTPPCNTTLTVPVTGGSVDVFGSYSTLFQKGLQAACAGIAVAAIGHPNSPNAVYVDMCTNAVNTMFQNSVNSVYYPPAPVPLATDQNHPFANIYLGLHDNGSGNITNGGALQGMYSFNTNASLMSTNSASACSSTYSPKWNDPTQDPTLDFSVDWIACGLVDLINKTVIANDTSGSAPTGGNASLIVNQSNVSQFAQDASFSGLIDTLMGMLKGKVAAQQKADNTPNLLSEGIPGTGNTCGPDGRSPCYENAANDGQGEGSCPPGATNCTTFINPNYHYISPINFSNSWWYASDIYLTLNQQLADNIRTLAKAVQSFKLDPSAIQLGHIVNDNCSGTNATTGKACFQPEMKVDMALMTYNGVQPGKGMLIPASATPLLKGADGTPQVSGISIPLNQQVVDNANVMLESWSQLICAYQTKPTDGQSGGNVQDADQQCYQAPDSSFYTLLSQMPSEYQVPIGDLLYLTQQAPGKLYNDPNISAAQAYANTKQLIQNIVGVLVANHIYPGSQTQPFNVDSQAEISPVQRLVQQINNSLIGRRLPGNYSPFGNGENDRAATAAVGAIFYEIYQLGNNTPTSMQDVINGSFNNIATAQRIGLSMINLVLNAAQMTTQFITNTMQGFIKQDQSSAKQIEEIGGIGGAVTGGLGIIGGFMGDGGTMALVANTTTQILVMKKQVELQQQMVNQNYDMMMDLMWIPIGVCIATMLFSAGVSFALLVPLIPYILFWAGQIAWLLGVIEAMIAAPLLALAITHPGGHETWGHTVPGMKMLLGVVLRPVLMVLGLITGLVLTFIVIKFSSQGFQIISSQIIAYAGQAANYSAGPNPNAAGAASLLGPNATVVQGVLASMMLMLFCGFMVMAFNKCFSTIYLFPEKVVQWIGGQAASAGKEEMQQVSGQASQMGSQMGQAGGQSMGQFGQGSASRTQGSGQASASEAEKSAGIASSTAGKGESIGGAAKEARKGSTNKDSGPSADEGS